MRLLFASGFAALALAACSPTGNTAGGTIGADGLETVATTEPSSSRTVPEAFSSTAWRAIAEDGARYVTEIDPDGTYRDLRNGDPWQTGSWTYSKDEGDKFLCFTPDSENGAERCWRPERMNGDTMRARSGDTEIELTRVEYAPPGEGSEQAE